MNEIKMLFINIVWDAPTTWMPKVWTWIKETMGADFTNQTVAWFQSWNPSWIDWVWVWKISILVNGTIFILHKLTDLIYNRRKGNHEREAHNTSSGIKEETTLYKLLGIIFLPIKKKIDKRWTKTKAMYTPLKPPSYFKSVNNFAQIKDFRNTLPLEVDSGWDTIQRSNTDTKETESY